MKAFAIVISAAIYFTFMMVIDEMLGILDAWNPRYAYFFPLLGPIRVGDAWTWIVFPILVACFLFVAWFAVKERTQANTK